MYKLSKDFRFESAHRLANGYQGKCKNIHGHSWNGSITISTTKLDKFGFALDYAEIKKFTKPYVEDKLDHTILLKQTDLDLINLCQENNWAYVTFRENPTSEVIAKHIYNQAVIYFSGIDPDIVVNSVSIKETCTSKCEYIGS